jgi:hypothetical protein
MKFVRCISKANARIETVYSAKVLSQLSVSQYLANMYLSVVTSHP